MPATSLFSTRSLTLCPQRQDPWLVLPKASNVDDVMAKDRCAAAGSHPQCAEADEHPFISLFSTLLLPPPLPPKWLRCAH